MKKQKIIKKSSEEATDRKVEAGQSAVTFPMTSIEKMENYLSQHYHFRLNEVTGRLEFKELGSTGPFMHLSDYQINSIARRLTKSDISCRGSMVRNLLLSDYTPVYNPFKHYLNNLPPWDEQTDYIQQLAATVKTTDDSLWQTCFRKWLVAMVGSLIQDEVVNHTVIVFSGKQGIGKTSWILNLVPSQLNEYRFSGTVNPGNKDSLVQLSECMLINLDELENLNRSELGTIKELITKESVRIRRPYGYSSETMPRKASFAGSVNGKEFLSDTTGSRRFLCFEATEIEYMHTIMLDGVYAQAIHLFQHGIQYWFSPADIDAINKNNEQFRLMAMEEELLLQYFEPCDEDEADHLFSTTELLNRLSKIVKINVTDPAKQKMGKALRAHGFLRIKRQHRYVYALKEKDQEATQYADQHTSMPAETEVSG
jgi:predicted P-loop ATPase